MKTRSAAALLVLIPSLSLSLVQNGSAQEQTSAQTAADATSTVAQKPLPADPEERFKFLFTNAYLSGRWAALRDGELGEERTGDKYNIVSVIKGEGDNWIVNARLKYRDQEIVAPIPVKMKFSGDTAVLTVDNLMVPGGGSYTARLLIYERTYSGTWKGQRGGGMLYGTISNETE